MTTALTTWRMAWRNLWRNRRRTALAVAAIGLSVALVLVFDGVLRWEADFLLDTITGPMLGHVQVHAPEWRRTRDLDKTLTGVSSIVDALRADPAVASVAPRIYAPALGARGEEGFAVVVLGVDLTEERQPSRLLARLDRLPGPRDVLVGRQLAEQMGLRPGDEIALVGQAVDGSLANDLFRVAALLDTPVELVNRQAVVMPIAAAQQLFAMPDEAHEIVVHARDLSASAGLASRLAAQPALHGAEVLDWRALAPAMLNILNLLDVVWLFILVLVLIAATAGVANTMLMATFERTHEFGMLLALGTAPSRVVALIALESVALGLIGAVVGAAIGGGLVAWAHHTGFDYAALTGVGPSSFAVFGLQWSLDVHPRLEAIDFLRVVVAVVVTSLVASAWPAARAARLQPASALRD